ncbi:MAG: ABC transporter ATP-binding protein [Thermofilaceae archaeon]
MPSFKLLKRYRFINLYHLLFQHRWLLVAVLLLSLVSMSLGIVSPLVTRAIIDQGVMRGDFGVIAVYSGVLVLILAAATALGALRGYYQQVLSGRFALDLRSMVFSKAMELGMELYQSTQVGDLVTRLYGYVDRVQRFVLDSFSTILLNSIQLAAMLVVVFALSWKLALIMLLPLPLYIYGLVHYQPKMRTLFTKRWSRVSRMSAYVSSLFNAVLLVKLTGREREEARRFGSMAGDVYEAEVEVARLTSRVFPWLGFLLQLASVGVTFVGGVLITRGELTFGTLTAFLAYVWQVYGPVQAIAGLIPQLAEAEAAYEKLAEILEAKPKVSEAPDAVELKVRGEIEIEDVWFEYTPGRPVLKGVNLVIKPGDVVGIVGPNGSGKTTLVRLLVRLFDPTSGRVLYDGVDLRKVKLSSLRGQIILVPQEPQLLPGSVAYNIVYGVDDPDPISMIYAAWLCGAHRFIIELPLAYDSDVGEQGKYLSGGQRQLICLARAAMLKPKVLILDEATSNVHVELEEVILTRLLGYLRDTTVIAISHRPTLNKFVNRTILMSDGRVLGEDKGGLGERPDPPPPLRVIDAGEIRVIDRGAWLEAELDGARLKELRARLPFPLSNPRVLLLYRNPDEPLIIRDWTLLDKASKLAVARHLIKEHKIAIARLIDVIPVGGRGARMGATVKLESDEGLIELDVAPTAVLSLDGALVVTTYERTYIIDPERSSKEALWKASALAFEPPSPFRSHGVRVLMDVLAEALITGGA